MAQLECLIKKCRRISNLGKDGLKSHYSFDLNLRNPLVNACFLRSNQCVLSREREREIYSICVQVQEQHDDGGD